MDINPKKLLRKPALKDKITGDHLVEIPSPNRQWTVVTSHNWEMGNNWWVCLFTLFNAEGKIVNQFSPLAAVPDSAVWTANGRFFAIAGFSSEFFYFIYDVMKEQFALIRIANPYPLALSFHSPQTILIAVKGAELQQSNLGWDEPNKEVPLERYVAQPPLNFLLSELTFYPEGKISSVPKLLGGQPQHDLKIVRDGIWPFDGVGPQSTDQEFYGRQMEIFHLELFAEYGDATAKEWLKEINRMTKGKYSKWDQVAKYLGVRKV